MTDSQTTRAPDIERDPTYLAAAEWLIRLQNPEVPLEDVLAWQAWMGASPTHARTFARIEETSQALRGLPRLPATSARELALDRYDAAVPLKDWQALRPVQRRWGTPATHRPWAALALAASVAVLALAFMLWKTPAPDIFTTSIGENRSITLRDGSTLTLGGDTRIEVALSRTARSIELTRGEAQFEVAKDPSRPFRVRAGNVRIVAVGTVFNIQRGSDRAVVSVTEGRVLVEPVARFLPMAVLREFEPQLRTVSVSAGQRTTTGSAGIGTVTKVDDPAAATSWQTGRLAFRLQALRYVLEDVNRYTRKPIVIEGDPVGELLITGTVDREKIPSWIESLERAFNLEATEEPERVVIRAR